MEKVMKKLSLSELSFIVLTDNYGSDLKNEAYHEIQKRFESNGCNYDAFIELEEQAIGKRGNDIENYLIGSSPDGQLLMELYFNYVYSNELWQHGNLLFSENLLCNSNSQRTFFTKALKIELNNLARRLQSLPVDSEEYQKLLPVYQNLYQRYSKKPDIWYEDSLTDCVMDLTTEFSSLMSKKRIEKLEKYAERWKNGSKVALIQCALWSSLTSNDVLDYLNMRRIANRDIAKLSSQRKSIITSLKEEDIDYSFIEDKKLELKK